jgi:hypothetical protein
MSREPKRLQPWEWAFVLVGGAILAFLAAKHS